MAVSTSNASFYADFAELNTLKREAKTQSKESLRAAAQQFESLFTQMMLKSMRAASFGDSLTGSEDMEFYQGMSDQQLAAQLSKGKGLGLADMLVEQLTRSGLVNEAQATAADAKPASEPESTIESSQPTTSSSWPPASRKDFIEQLWPQATQAAEKLGVAPATLVAHAALETGWGQKVPCNADGSNSFNLFGIKANAQWTGATNETRTHEFEDSTAVSRVDRFKSYASPAQCFDDYAALLGGASRYAGVRNSGGDAERFGQALQQGGYATDPNYAAKLSAVADSLNTLLGGDSARSSFTRSSRNSGGDVS